MQNLFKLTKGIDTFVCDLVTSIIICIIDMYAMYIDLEKRYDYPYFKKFNDLANNNYDLLHMV